RIPSTAAGHTKRTSTPHDEASGSSPISAIAFLCPHTHPTKIEMRNAPMLNEKFPHRILWTSRNPLPATKSVSTDDAPCDRAEGTASKKQPRVTVQTAFSRAHRRSSTK